MRKGSAERVVRKSITLNERFADQLEMLKERRGGVSESEIIRAALALFDTATADPKRKVVLRDVESGQEETFFLY